MLARRDDENDDGGDVSMNADNASKRQLSSAYTGLRYAVTLGSAKRNDGSERLSSSI